MCNYLSSFKIIMEILVLFSVCQNKLDLMRRYGTDNYWINLEKIKQFDMLIILYLILKVFITIKLMMWFLLICFFCLI